MTVSNNISLFAKKHWKTVAYTVGAMAVAGTAVYLTSAAARDAFQNLANTMQTAKNSLLKYIYDPTYTTAYREGQLRQTIQKINEDYEKNIAQHHLEAEERIESLKNYFQTRREEDHKEAVLEAEELYKEFYRSFLGNQAADLTIDQNCPRLNPSDFENMSDVERLTNNTLNPKCPKHAEILLTPKGQKYNPENFSTTTKVDSMFRKMSKIVHPDKLENAAEAFNNALTAKSILKIFLSQ